MKEEKLFRKAVRSAVEKSNFVRVVLLETGWEVIGYSRKPGFDGSQIDIQIMEWKFNSKPAEYFIVAIREFPVNTSARSIFKRISK